MSRYVIFKSEIKWSKNIKVVHEEVSDELVAVQHDLRFLAA
jgi:hypothetical protein